MLVALPPDPTPLDRHAPATLVPCAACLQRRSATQSNHDLPTAALPHRPMVVPPVLPLRDDPAADQRAQDRRARGLLAGVWDAHIHLFPDSFYAALHRWFDAHAWQIQFRGGAEQVLDQLAAAGTQRSVALVFAHKPGVARLLNGWLGELARAHPQVVPVGTVFPGEPDADQVVREAIGLHGLRGIKLHCHVMKQPIDSPPILQILKQCRDMGVPAVVHAGKEPASAAYGVDTRQLCDVQRTRAVLRALPGLQLVVPHAGADEYDAYLDLLADEPGLYLDTAMACAEYFADQPNWPRLEQHADRILYGTDFPIVPYAVDRELEVLARNLQSDEAFVQITRGTAQRLWGGH